MNQVYLEKLEYNKILTILSGFCKTDLGKKHALSLVPSANEEEVALKLSQTQEVLNLITRFGASPISEMPDITLHLKKLNSSGLIGISEILDLAYVLKMAQNLKLYFNNEDIIKEDYSTIEEYFASLYSNSSIIEKVHNCIIDKNTIADNASRNLSIIRRKRKKLEDNIKEKLNAFIHSSSHSKYIQEQLVTIRNDRYVIPVKEEYRSMIKGFVHDISSSGATVFIEPLSIFEANNEINNLKIDENIEIEKILQDLSSLFIPYIRELQIDYETIGILDFIFAKASYSKSIDGAMPKINQEKCINLINARHPLINKDVVVPISVNLNKDCSSLLITGPNTGGKTVCLKTIGLLVCMACSGLNVTADEGSSIYIFDNVFADIGDDQSIENSLSTFSSHMTNIVEILSKITSDSLVLIDELGSGTDPIEGANLAISILEHIHLVGSFTVCTTHYQELKKYALVYDGFQNASVEFNTESLMPTYRLLVGVPGKSNAFEISKKLGLPQSIIDRASHLLSSHDVNFEELLKKIYDDKTKIEHEKEEIEKNSSQIELLRKQLEKDNSDLHREEKEIISNAKQEARRILLNAKDTATQIIGDMKKIADSSKNIAKLNNYRNALNDKIKEHAILNTDADAVSAKSLSPEEIHIGEAVYVASLDKEGIIASNLSKSNEVQVQIGSMKTSVNIKFLEKSKKANKPAVSSTYSGISKSRTVSTEINVIGLTVDEAVPLVDKFLDDCYLAKLQTVRIVHGKGTGKLKAGIHSFLKKQPHVRSFRMGTFGEGEMGVTVVELK